MYDDKTSEVLYLIMRELLEQTKKAGNVSDGMINAIRQSVKRYKEFVEGDESFSEKGEVWYMMGQAYRQLADFKKHSPASRKLPQWIVPKRLQWWVMLIMKDWEL